MKTLLSSAQGDAYQLASLDTKITIELFVRDGLLDSITRFPLVLSTFPKTQKVVL